VKDYSNHKTKYGIIEHRGMFAVVEVNVRDGKEILSHKLDTLSLSKHVSTLQQQINEMIERESTPLATGIERWKEAKVKQRKLKERVGGKS
jgi:hypothetical protein